MALLTFLLFILALILVLGLIYWAIRALFPGVSQQVQAAIIIVIAIVIIAYVLQNPGVISFGP